MPFPHQHQAQPRLDYICSSPSTDAKGFEADGDLIIGHDIYPQWASGLSNGTTRVRSHDAMRAIRAVPTFDKTTACMVASPHFSLLVPPNPDKMINKSTTTALDLPYHILQDIVAMVATSAVTGKKREWKIKEWRGQQWKRGRYDWIVREPFTRGTLVDPAPTNDLVNLMKVSKTLHWIAGAELYSRLSKYDVTEGALEVMYKTKTDLLTHENRTLWIHFHPESECNGRQPSPSSFDQTPIPIRQLHISVRTRERETCQLFDCPSILRYLPQTLVLWMKEDCTFNTGLADRYYPYQIKNLVVRLGKPSDWYDLHNSTIGQTPWFRPFIKTKSVVFIIENDYMSAWRPYGPESHMGPDPEDDIYLRRDMRYNTEDNLHPWLSRFAYSLMDFCLDPDYAKDITIVNLGSVRSETLGLAEDYLDLEADFKCERCYTESQFEKMFCAEYNRIYSEQKASSHPVSKAKFKFIPFREYIRRDESVNTLSKDDEKYYAKGGDKPAWVDGEVYRACLKCGHTEEKVESREAVEAKTHRDGERLALLKEHWVIDWDAPRAAWATPPAPRKVLINGVSNRHGPW